MTITFNSYSEVAALQNTLLFACHSIDKINEMQQLSIPRAEQMRDENDIWDAARAKLANAVPNEPFNIWIG